MIGEILDELLTDVMPEKKKIQKAENCQKEVDHLFMKMYEDRANEKITKFCHAVWQIPTGIGGAGRGGLLTVNDLRKIDMIYNYFH